MRNVLDEQTWSEASLAEMELEFLRAEREKLVAHDAAHLRDLLEAPDLADAAQNEQRRMLLARRRPMLEHVPADTRWFRVSFLAREHLGALLVIGSADWVDPRGRDRNELPMVAGRRPEPFRGGAEGWAKPILWGHERKEPFTILEGNHRLLTWWCEPTLSELRMVTIVGVSRSTCIWHLPDQSAFKCT
jgi:hypothetical protein